MLKPVLNSPRILMSETPRPDIRIVPAAHDTASGNIDSPSLVRELTSIQEWLYVGQEQTSAVSRYTRIRISTTGSTGNRS